MTMLTFFVDGQPQGKGRPRVTRYGTYTPKSTKAYEKHIQETYKELADWTFFEGPVEVRLECTYRIPKSWSKKKQQAALNGETLPTVKPDLDNIAKAICDALNGYCWADDNQVVSLTASKHYGPNPGVMVHVIGDR